ncbi:MAG: outer membrane beta-barrel protein, partial [Pseudomonadota bacterium]
MRIQESTSAFLASALACILVTAASASDVVTSGLSPASNTFQSFQNGSIARDSRLNRPLDLLNDFYPSITVTVTDHDNVRRRTDLDEADTRVVISPSLAYRTNLGRHPFYLAYSGSFAFHDSIESEDAESHGLSAYLGLDLSQDWDLDLFAGLGTSYEERGISGSRSFTGLVGSDREFDALASLQQSPDEFDYRRYGFDLAYGKKSSALSAVFGLERVETDFTNNNQGDENFFGNRDRESTSAHLDVDYQFSDRTSVFGRVQRTEVDYVRSINSLDHEQTDYMLGLRWKPSQGLSGVV